MDRVSPVFDVAESLQIFEIEDGRVEQWEERPLIGTEFYSRAREVSGYRVDTVICGAVSRPLEVALQGAGIRVVGFIRGQIDEVVRAFVEGRLEEEIFLMPGCCRRAGQFVGRQGRWRLHNRSTKGGSMKIAVTSIDGTMEGKVDERFGRCRKVVIYDPETQTIEAVDNNTNMGLPQGAGIQTAQNVLNAGARALISGHLGPKAFQVLSTAGIDVYLAIGMTVSEALSQFKEGKLTKLAGADVSSHW
jgi:predicted Fe-Mo cluster-binding NifX family protein